MKKRCRWVSFAAAVAMALLLTGCSLPMTGFADYDVSGYFRALLNSSYKGDNTEYVSLAGTSEEEAAQNNTTTVQNAAVNFCNTYGISPSDDQLAQLEDVMRQALNQADFTVKDEQKVEGGYYLEVEIVPIVNFRGLESEIDTLREEAQKEATAANSQSSAYEEDSDTSDTGDEYGYDSYDDGYGDSYDQDSGNDYGYGENGDEDSSSSQAQEEEPAKTVNANELFVDKVVEYCQGQLSNIQYGTEAITIALDIRQTSEGELQLDTNQLDTIDRTVLQFQS